MCVCAVSFLFPTAARSTCNQSRSVYSIEQVHRPGSFSFSHTWTARVDDVSEFNFLFKPSIIYNILIQDTLFTLCSSDLHPSKYQVCVARGIGVTFVLK